MGDGPPTDLPHRLTGSQGRQPAPNLGLGAIAPIEAEPSLREQVGAWLRDAVFTGELEPGTTFSVPSIAERFGVSATPVREAVLDLVHQNLVVAVPSRGFRVLDPTPEAIVQTVEIRRLLELPTMRAIARKVQPIDLIPLRLMADAITQHAENADLRQFVKFDYAFHRQTTGMCGNQMLTDLIEETRSRARIHTIPYVARLGSLLEAAEHHHQLIDAMERRDLDEVTRVTEAHMAFALAYARDVQRSDPT